MTFSGSGVSTSVGGKGFRVTSGPRGTYVTVSAGGIRYRQRIDGQVNNVHPAAHLPHPATQPPPQPQASTMGTPVATADAESLVELSSAATLEKLNQAGKEPAYAWMFLAGGGVLGLVLAQIHVIVTLLDFGLTLYLAWLANSFDVYRRTFHLNYQMDQEASRRWSQLNQWVSSMGKSQRLWRVNTQDYTYDQKRNAGASSLLTRSRASVQQRKPSLVESNITPYCLDIGGQQLFFFPDRVYVLQNGVFGAVEYSSLQLAVDQTRFIEEEGVPSDSQVVGHTWRYVNKSGGPDRRFNNNYQIPIAQYGVVELKSPTGLHVLLQTSSVNVAQQCQTLFHAFHGHQPNQQRQTQQPPPRPRQQPKPPPQKPPTPQPIDCYKVLGLSANCTKEEAAAKYRAMMMAYHPDRVSHLAEDFQALAHKKAQEINLAYAEIKRLRGW
jgi:hypothetical protein